jgi:hypothetical protein
MSNDQIRVIPFQRNASISESDELVANVAYTLWHSAPFRCGPPEGAFFTALRMVKGRSSVGPFLVPRRKQKLQPIIVVKSRSGGGPRRNAARARR